MTTPLTPVSLRWQGAADGSLEILDQTLLPGRLEWLPCQSVDAVIEAIRMLRVRGAPAIGIAGAYGMVVAAGEAMLAGHPADEARAHVLALAERLATARPTAVNLRWAVERCVRVIDQLPDDTPASGLATALLVPWLVLASPGPLKLAGVAPAWAVLWLLPWALVDGTMSGALAGLGLGLVLDSLHLGPISEIPALALLGWWWGRMGRLGPPIERSFSLGLLALIGAALVGGSLLLQSLLAGGWPLLPALHTWLAQTLLTALLAPPLCSLQLLLWRRQTLGGRS